MIRSGLHGLNNVGVLGLPMMAGGALGLPPFIFDLALITFTPGMAKRISPGPFATAPIVQGEWAGTGTPDAVTYPPGTQLGNPFGLFSPNIDGGQGTLTFWITPEWEGDDGITHGCWRQDLNIGLEKNASDNLYVNIYTDGGWIVAGPVSTAAWNAGTAYFITIRWDRWNTLDGTNYVCISVNNVNTFDRATAITLTTIAAANIYVGSQVAQFAADALIEGLTLYRRPLWDGTYGVDVGNGDEIEDMYAAGAGADPCLITGSWDVVFCLPTDSTAGALVTGAGEAWSHPHGSNIPDVWGNWDGGLPGTPYCVEFNGTTTSINCGSDVDIDDIHDAEFTVEAWIRADGWGEETQGRIAQKSTNTTAEGWSFYLLAGLGLRAFVACATTNASSNSGADEFTPDGKWHHVVMYFNDAGDRKIYFAVDGKWSSDGQTAGIGAVVTDVTRDLYIGAFGAGSFVFDGGIAWVAISNNARYTPGTDFIPPRAFPADDANYLASWPMNEGTGAAIDNIGNQGGGGSGAANRDGTLANGSWSSIWEVEGTPVVPRSILYDGAATSTVVADAAAIQDIQDGVLCAEAWISANDWGESNVGRIFEKTESLEEGWFLSLFNTVGIVARIYCATTDAVSELGTDEFIADGIAHHVAMQFDDAGDRKIYLWIDGVPVASYPTQDVGVGAIVSDVGNDLYLGNRSDGVATFDGRLGGWARISDIARYTNSKAFVPDAFDSPPALPDVNSVWQTDYSDGAGTTLTDGAAGGNNGTITFGAGKWLNTPDMELQEPGARIFEWGYNIGSDGASDGITTIETVTAATDYVIRLMASYGQSGRAWPEVYLYDNTNAAQIGATYALPRVSDLHTGGNDSATLINANGAFTQQLVGWTAYNVTDGSSTVITAVSGDKTTITGVLAGGTDNDWDTNDVYVLRPPAGAPYCTHPFATESIFVFATPAGCVSMDIKIRNAAGEGVLQIHQCEVLASLVDNGDMEAAFVGVPPIPPLWVNSGLDAGDTQAEAVIIHAGTQSMRFNAGAVWPENMFGNADGGVDSFVSVGCWMHTDGQLDAPVARYVFQASSATRLQLNQSGVAVWEYHAAVARRAASAGQLRVGGESAQYYIDDIFAVTLDPITLTVTPASQANSLESGGIRVDGRDECTQPIPVGYLGGTGGWMRWRVRPRHADANLIAFQEAATPFAVWFSAPIANYITLDFSAANTIRLEINDGAATNATVVGPALVADTEYLFEIRYTAAQIQFSIDGVVEIAFAPAGGIDFLADIPTFVWWGSRATADLQADIVFLGP